MRGSVSLLLRHYALCWLFITILLPALSYSKAVLDRRELRPLSSDDLKTLVSVTDPLKNLDPANPASHLSKILIPRAPDTENNTFVRNYIVSTLKALKWHVELDEFTDNTPIGRKRFANIIATKDPNASRRVVLSAHFDSKYYPQYPENQFVGATDSAAPCAMILDLAETLDPLLDKRKERLEEGSEDDDDVAETTLQLIFFDGEEAFKDWTDTDSIYGARHLAEKMSTTYVSPHQRRRLMNVQTTELDEIEHLILLDLLGAPNPYIRSFFVDTAWLFDSMVSAERRLGESGAFVYGKDGNNMAPGQWRSWFRARVGNNVNFGYVGDDHIPFLHKGVSILHIISEPFPRVWHTLGDDASALDPATMRRWNLILRVFMAEYLHLQPQDFASRSESSRTVQRSESELVSIGSSTEWPMVY
uniref:Peptide hydrolase n=1 Tax=Psilocybe cubensis TaxID=181762 RepID=A0A8H7Y2I5_PSICU